MESIHHHSCHCCHFFYSKIIIKLKWIFSFQLSLIVWWSWYSNMNNLSMFVWICYFVICYYYSFNSTKINSSSFHSLNLNLSVKSSYFGLFLQMGHTTHRLTIFFFFHLFNYENEWKCQCLFGKLNGLIKKNWYSFPHPWYHRMESVTNFTSNKF